MNNERVTLAQELHDGIAQDLVALGFSIDAVIASDITAEARSSLRSIRFTITQLIEKVREEIHALRVGEALDDSSTSINLNYELQRIFQEIIRNVQEHSQAHALTIEVSDNGIGGAQETPGSFGLKGLQERAAKLNGEIHIDSDQEGTRIKLQIPLDR